MNRATSERFNAATESPTSANARWETPPAIFAKLHFEYGFEIDLTADASNHLCPAWYGPGSPYGTDVLRVPWAYGHVGYSNPPYGPFVPYMLARAKVEATRGFTTVLLLPMRVTKAFLSLVLHGAHELLFCDKRIYFYEGGKPRANHKTGKPDPAMFDSIIVVYKPHLWLKPKVGVWVVPPHV